jgi:DNA-binding beta-propeller fold protein YncE
MLTLAYDAATGAFRWRAFVVDHVAGLVGFRHGASVGVSPDNATVYVTGSTYSKTQGWQYTTAAYAAATGTQRWLSTFNADDSDYAKSLAVSPDGSTVYVTGTSDVSGGFSTYYTIAYRAADGVERWAKRYPLLGDVAGLALSPDGTQVFVSGVSSAGNGWNFVTVCYAASNGAKQWDATYDGPAHRDDYGEGLAVAPDGASVYVTGTSLATATEEDFATVAYSASSGAQLWASRHRGPAHGQGDASGVVAGPGGTRVYMTGWDVGENGSVGWDTIAYRASDGGVLWNSRLDAPKDQGNFAIALAASADRTKLYVVGTAFRRHHDDDYTTVAYLTGARP